MYDQNGSPVESNRAMGILAYIGWLVIIPLLLVRGSRFVTFHCNQGLVLAIAETVVGVTVGVLRLIPILGIFFYIAGSVFGVLFLILSIIGIVSAARGEERVLPIIGGITILR